MTPSNLTPTLGLLVPILAHELSKPLNLFAPLYTGTEHVYLSCPQPENGGESKGKDERCVLQSRTSTSHLTVVSQGDGL